MIPEKCANEERNIEEVRHKIKLSNHSATRLVRFWQKPNQDHCLLSVAMETTPSCQTGTCKIRWTGDYFVMKCSPLTPQPPVTIQTARLTIPTGNIGKWLSENFFGWKNYSDQPNPGATSETTRTWKTWHTTSAHPFILRRGRWTDDYDGHLILGDLVCLKLPAISLMGLLIIIKPLLITSVMLSRL